MTGIQKAAALLATLGEEASANIVKHLTEDEVERVSQAIAQMTHLPSERAESVLEEFDQMVLAQQYVIKGGLEYARGMLTNAFGAGAAKRLLDKVEDFILNDVANIDVLRKADPQQLANFIHNEHPQTIAMVLSHLGTEQAATLLCSLPKQVQLDSALRMAHIDQISPEIINKISSVIEQKLKSLGEFSRESYGGVKAVADMINRLDPSESKGLLKAIEEVDSSLHETIRQLMFVFEDLLSLDMQDLKELMQRVDRKVLTVALKGTSEHLRNRIMSVLSPRAAQMLREDIDVLGAVRIREVEGAQLKIIEIIRELEQEGKISLRQSEYVV